MVVVVPVVEVQSNLQITGITAAEFNTPAQTAAYATAIEDSLTVDPEVTNVVATSIARRRLPSSRQLLQCGIDVSYTLQMAIEEGLGLSLVHHPPLPTVE